jgi:periplasmic protein CpxP/Spy
MTPLAQRRPIAIAVCLAALTGAAALAGPLSHTGDPAQGMDRRLERMTQELKLTADQQTQIRALIDEQHTAIERLRQETRKRIDALLTDAQRTERDRLVERRLDRRVDRLAERLDLTDEQSDKIRAILKEGHDNPEANRGELRERVAAVLTPEQRKEFETMRERHGDRRQGDGPESDRGPGRGPGPGPGPGGASAL